MTFSSLMLNHSPSDIVSPDVRSRMMRAVRQSGTAAELLLRSLVASLGVRYRVNRRALPGSPDLSNESQGWAMFVHGCFWHGHGNCPRLKSARGGRIPVVNFDFWRNKIEQNQKRDARKARELRRLGFRVLVVWECELRNPEKLSRRIARFLYGTGR